jgi:hypothetical protein
MRRFASSSKSINLTVSDERVLKRFPSSPHTTYTPHPPPRHARTVGKWDKGVRMLWARRGKKGSVYVVCAYPEAHVVEPLARGHPARGAGRVEDHVEVCGL